MGDDDDAVMGSETSGTDLDDARDLYGTHYPGDRALMDVDGTPFRYRYTARGGPDVSVRTSEFRGRARGSSDASREYIVSWLHEGHATVEHAGELAEYTAGVPRMSPTEAYEFEFVDYRQSLVHLDADYLERVSAEHEGAAGGRLRFDHMAVPSPAARAAWAGVLREAVPHVVAPGTPPLLRREADRRIAMAVLDTFAHESDAPSATETAVGSSRVRDAVDYMHAHAHLPLTVGDVAAAVDLSARGLQAALRRSLGQTPLAYLRSIRLDRVRIELTISDPRQTTVAEIARGWGFGHPGRFAAAYHARYGEYPGETLQR